MKTIFLTKNKFSVVGAQLEKGAKGPYLISTFKKIPLIKISNPNRKTSEFGKVTNCIILSLQSNFYRQLSLQTSLS